MTRELTPFFQEEPDLFVSILQQLLVDKPQFRYVILNQLFSVTKFQKELGVMNQKLRYGCRISRKKWTHRIAPIFANLTNMLNGPLAGRFRTGGLHMVRGKNHVEEVYRVNSDVYIPHQQHAVMPGGGVAEIPAAHFPMLNLLQLQLSTPSIRDSMHFLRIETTETADANMFIGEHCLVGEYCIIIKVCRDGFVLQLGRMMEMTIMINCNVRGLCNSKQLGDIVSLASVHENATNLYLLCQQVDKEMLLLQVFGVPDPVSGQLVKIICFNQEDSSSAEKGFGRPGANQNGKWMWDKFGNKLHLDKWEQFHCPLSMTAAYAERGWRRFCTEKFTEYCRNKNIQPDRAQFEHAEQFEDYDRKKKEYRLAQNYIATHFKDYGFSKGAWNRAVGQRQSGMDPLHQVMRVIILTFKHMGVALLQYHLEVQEDDHEAQRKRNHGDTAAEQLSKFSLEEILHHYHNHVHLDLKYNKDDPGRSKVKARMLCIFY